MYNWWKYVHIVAVFAFLASHGVSIFVLYRIRGERDRAKILQLVSFSGETTLPMYVSVGAIVGSGVVAGVMGQWFRYGWIWASLAVLLLTIALMLVTAKPYFARIKAACAVRPSGVPRVSDEELASILRSSTAHVVTAIGGVGLLVVLYLMVFKPGVS